MKHLNEEQQRAICHKTGPMMVLAGPGSGKTTVITYRIRHLIKAQGIPGRNILVITFTKAAANEMKMRFSNMIKQKTDVHFGTFHSIFFQIISKVYHYDRTDIVTEAEKYRIIRELIIRYSLHYDGQDEFARNILSEISLVKGELMNIEDYHSHVMKKEDFILIYKEYNRLLREKNKIDFDDMLVLCYELLNSRMDILENWKQEFRYILIDEFQDINKIQYEVIKLLAGAEMNLFVVGDDDQSVYSFRGAKPEIMLGFTKDFPDTEIVTLNINYRCSREIVSASKRMIENNQKRYKKELFSAEKRVEESVFVILVKNLKEEYQNICTRITGLHKNTISFHKMAILYRTNQEAESIARILMEYNIPFQIRDTIPDIFQHFVVEAVLDYIYISLGDRSRMRFLRIINKPNRNIPREVFMEEQTDLDILQDKISENHLSVRNLNTLKNDLSKISKMSPYAAVNYIRKAIGYDGYIKEHADRKGIDPQEYLELLDELMDMAKKFLTYSDWFQYIACYQENFSKRSREDRQPGDAVTLATMHSAKGLEFDHVFIMNAVEGRTPHKKALKEGNVEEERRMFYVAATRARCSLYILVPQSMHGKKTQTSRFVMEMKDAGNT